MKETALLNELKYIVVILLFYFPLFECDSRFFASFWPFFENSAASDLRCYFFVALLLPCLDIRYVEKTDAEKDDIIVTVPASVSGNGNFIYCMTLTTSKVNYTVGRGTFWGDLIHSRTLAATHVDLVGFSATIAGSAIRAPVTIPGQQPRVTTRFGDLNCLSAVPTHK